MIGSMEKRLVLQRPKRTPDSGGGAAVSYESYARAWAALSPRPARVDAGGERDAKRRRFIAILRTRADIDFMTRVLIDGCAFNVTDLQQESGAARLTLGLEEAL